MSGLAAWTRPATTALLLLGSAILCGLRLPAGEDRSLAFEAFGFVEGVLALLALHLFIRQGALPFPSTSPLRITLPYWLCATAVMLRLALPPPGVGYWIGAGLLTAALLGASGGADRRRTLFTLGTALAICGVLRFSVIPFVWRSASLPDLGPVPLGGVSDWAKGLFTEYHPVRTGNEVLNVAGIALYAAALWRAWPAGSPAADPWVLLPAEERERILRIMIASTLPPPGASPLRLEAGVQTRDPSAPAAPVREPGAPAPGPAEPPDTPPGGPPFAPPAEPPPADPTAPPPSRRDPARGPDEPAAPPRAPVKEPQREIGLS
ncbi:MAG: hypothetical protein H0V09_02370 [Gemmatimonadetes bacterium]|nr:hypothetical protein [Gemmatimonadota bacterium]